MIVFLGLDSQVKKPDKTRLTNIEIFIHVFCSCVLLCSSLEQFVCVESLVTAIVDMYPAVFRRKNRRELLLLAVALFSFLMGLIMLMEVGGSHTDAELYTDQCMQTKICKHDPE